MGAHDTSVFQNGDKLAVNLPDDTGFGAGTRVRVERRGDRIVIAPVDDPETKEEVQRRMRQLIADLDAIGRPGEVEERDPDIFPDRAGLYD